MGLDQAQLDGIGRALATQPHPLQALALLLTEARRLTRAEAGTIYLRKGDRLHFAIVQNDVLARQFGEDELPRRFAESPLSLAGPSIAGYVALTRASLRIPDAYEIPSERPYAFDRQRDGEYRYRTRSILALPIQDARGGVFGVLQLINALNDAGQIVAFDSASEDIAAALLTRLARSMLPAASP
jgi:GAF domain-containing protein